MPLPGGGCKDESIDLFAVQRDDPANAAIKLRPGPISDTTDGTTVAHSARIDPEGDALLDVTWHSCPKSDRWISVVAHRVIVSDATAGERKWHRRRRVALRFLSWASWAVDAAARHAPYGRLRCDQVNPS